MDNYTELRERLEAVKVDWPENWKVGKSGRIKANPNCEVINEKGDSEFGTWFICEAFWPQHAAYIAAAQPAVIKQLLADYDILKQAFDRQADNMAFVLNHIDLHKWYDKFESELSEDRRARARIELGENK